MRLFLTIALVGALSGVSAAQEAAPHARALSLAWLGDRMDRRDEIISPGRYGGLLWGARLAYDGDWTRHRTQAALEVSTGQLTGPFSTGSHQTVYDARLGGSYLRPSRVGFVGAELSLRASAFSHTYGSGPFTEDYGLLLISLSPMIDWDHGAWRVRGSAPLVSLVSRPYSRLNVTRGDLPLHVAGPDELRAVSVDVSHTSSMRRKVALRTAYTLHVQSFAEQYGLAAVENRFSAAVLLRFGRSR